MPILLAGALLLGTARAGVLGDIAADAANSVGHCMALKDRKETKEEKRLRKTFEVIDWLISPAPRTTPLVPISSIPMPKPLDELRAALPDYSDVEQADMTAVWNGPGDLEGLRFAVTQRFDLPSDHAFTARLLNPRRGMDGQAVQDAQGSLIAALARAAALPFDGVLQDLQAGAKTELSEDGRSLTLTARDTADEPVVYRFHLAGDLGLLVEELEHGPGPKREQDYLFNCRKRRCLYWGRTGGTFAVALKWRTVSGYPLVTKVVSRDSESEELVIVGLSGHVVKRTVTASKP
jgi:hypothetical protein